MKKLLCVLLTLCLLPWSVAWANAPADGIATAVPENMSAALTYTEQDSFYQQPGESPWSFEYTPVGSDDYRPLEFIDTGWFHETYQNWSFGTVQYPNSMHAGTIGDPVVAFTAPFDGTVQIHRTDVKKGASELSDGVQIKILKNDQQLFPAEGWADLQPGTSVAVPDLIFDVRTGDVIRFRVNCIVTQDADGLTWSKTVSYLQEDAKAAPAAGVTAGFPDGLTLSAPSRYTDDFTGANPDSPWKFQNAEVGANEYFDLEYFNGWFSEFYQNWRSGAVPYPGTFHPGEAGDGVATYVCPEDGLLALPGSVVTVSNERSDGARFSITKNNLPIYPAMGMVVVKGGRSETVPDLLFAVKKGDEIHFRVNCNANQNYDGVSWDPEVCYAEGTAELPADSAFADLDGHWAEEAVAALYARGIVVGKSEGVFDPEAQVTRAEFLTMVQKAAGIPPSSFKEYYADVPVGAWFSNTIASAYDWDLIADELTPDGKFLPDRPILREEMTAILVDTLQNLDYRALEQGNLSRFTDAGAFAEWVQERAAQSLALGLILGNPDGSFAPKATATRAEASVILQRFLAAAEATDPEGTYSEVYDAKVYADVDVQKLITDAYASGAKSVTIPAGAYRMRMDGAQGHIVLRDMKDFTINADGVTFLYQTINAPGLVLSNCENITINGLTTDYENVGFYQGEILSVAEDKRSVEVRLDPAYPHHLLDENEFYTDSLGAGYYRADGTPVPNLTAGGLKSVSKLGQYRYRFYLPADYYGELIKPGDRVGGRAKVGDNISISNCGPIHMKDVTVHTGLTGIGENHTNGGSTYENLQIVPGPKPEGARLERIFSVNGTGYFARSVRKGAVMENIAITHTNDDGINVHSVYGRVAGQEDSKTVVLAFGGYDDFLLPVGDTLRFSEADVTEVAEAKIVSAERCTYTPGADLSDTGVTGKRNYTSCYRVTLDRAVEVAPQYYVENSSLANNGLTIRNSRFGYNSPRAILTHANDALIENCTFEWVFRCAILIEPELDWGESGYARNVTIRNCTFANCGFSTTNGAAIDISGYNGRDHKNITVEGCTFENQFRYDIIAKNIDGGLLQNNRFGSQNPGAGAALLDSDYPAVLVDNTQDLTLKNNTIGDENRGIAVTDNTENIQNL